MTNKPKTYLFLHGAYHGGWCWDSIKELLEKQGHKVYAPDLPGLGEDTTSRNNIDLNTHCKFIIDYIKKNNLKNITLVGHSYAGVIIEHSYKEIKNHLSEVIFISALVLNNGESVFDFMPEDKTEMYRTLAKESTDNSIPVSFEIARSCFFEYNTELEAKELFKKLTPHPAETYETQVDAKEFFESDIKKIFVYCEKDNIVKPKAQEIFIERLGNNTTIRKINSGHDPMISHVGELVRTL